MYATHPYPNLPDPMVQPEFYDSVVIKRGLAWVIDAALILMLVIPAVVMTAFIGLFFLPLMFLVVGFVYRVATITGGSATWGMRLMSIEFRDQRGEYFDFSQALMHTLGYTVSMSVFPLQLISIAMMFLTERGQGLTDLLLGTVAINRRA
ncbi:RDD family protein [Marivita sp. S6314]|uniref:RDD family protein n=1 Tax=Marivita sp. S6314 TaxID=2926406 RepID=UPI001FF1A502|nr:RDD family protein [Marivita sp. S6314]MCK0148907.1 RDD family protein [Marivita sp. S6314]